MKVWKLNIDVFVFGTNEQDATYSFINEMDSICESNEKLFYGYSVPKLAELQKLVFPAKNN